MFFESESEILEIATKCSTAIFVVPNPSKIDLKAKNVIFLQPDAKASITIEQVKKILPKLSARQIQDLFIVIRPAEVMNIEAANALLKSLEQPSDKVHFVLLTSSPSMILPTITSRASLYFLKTPNDNTISADEKIKNIAKQMLTAKGADLVALAEEIAKKKESPRGYALEILRVAIEMLYKTYFITKKQVFVKKLPKFLDAYDKISQNGHIKLQIVSCLC